MSIFLKKSKFENCFINLFNVVIGRHRAERHSPLTALEHRSPFSLTQISFRDFVPESKYNFCAPIDESVDADKRINILQERLSELRKTYLNIKSEVALLDRKKKKARKREREKKDLINRNNNNHNNSNSGSDLFNNNNLINKLNESFAKQLELDHSKSESAPEQFLQLDRQLLLQRSVNRLYRDRNQLKVNLHSVCKLNNINILCFDFEIFRNCNFDCVVLILL